MTPFDLKRLFPAAHPDFLAVNPSPQLVRKKPSATLPLIDNKKVTERRISENKHVQDHDPSPSSKPKRTPLHEPVGQEERKSADSSRLLVSVTSFRRRLLDPDNLIPKYFIDCLRYCGILSGDTEAEIDLRISQKKVSSKEEERTEIEIEGL